MASLKKRGRILAIVALTKKIKKDGACVAIFYFIKIEIETI
jgi:hypothetical protein